jgi:hypothetical protein
VLFFLKGSRVREYQKENLAILAAPEGELVDISYSRRWVTPGVRVPVGEGGVIVFADSPYEHFVPVRFAVVRDVEDTDERVRITVRLGPFVCCDDPGALDARWPDRPAPDRPGLRFLVEDDNPGFFTPRGPADIDAAWRTAVDGLAANSYFAEATAARIHRVATAEHDELDLTEAVAAGDAVEIDVETRTPSADRDHVEVHLDADPPGSAELADVAPTLPATGRGTVAVRLLHPGPVRLRLSFRPEPLRSSRPTVDLRVADTDAPPTPAATQAVTVGGVEPRALHRFLARDATLSDDAWVRLLDDLLLPALPDDPLLLDALAYHALAAGRPERAADALAHIAHRTPEQELHLVVAALRAGRPEQVAAAVGGADLGGEAAFAELIDAAGTADPSTVRALLETVLDDDLLGDSKLTLLVERTWPQVTSVDLALRAAGRVVYLEPLVGARLLLDRWPDPADMPEQVLVELLDWQVLPERLGPHLRHRIDRARADGDLAAVEQAVDRAEKLGGTAERTVVLAAGAAALLAADDPERQQRGFDLLGRCINDALTQGELDLATECLPTLVGWSTTRGEPYRSAAGALDDRVADAIEASDAFRGWQRLHLATAADRLRPHLVGRTLHCVGGWRPEWADELCGDLGLTHLVWHETEKRESAARHDWAEHLEPEADVVVIVTSHIGHDVSGKVKAACTRAGVTCVHAQRGRRSVVDELVGVLAGEGS